MYGGWNFIKEKNIQEDVNLISIKSQVSLLNIGFKKYAQDC